MKVLKLLCSTLLLCGVFYAQAAPKPIEGKVIVKTEVEGKSLTVQLANLQDMSTSLALTSLDGEVEFYRRQVQDHNGFTQLLHLNRLPEGRYRLTVRNDGETYVKIVKVDEKHVLVSQ